MSDHIEFPCPHCDGNIRTSAQYAGKHGACPHCGKTVTIQGEAAQVETTTAAVKTGGDHPRSSTDVNALLAGLIAAGITCLLYGVFLALGDTCELFTQRGPIPYIVTVLTCWGLTILALKYVAVKRQLSYAERELELLPLEEGVQIAPNNVEMFLQHLDSLPKDARGSILGQRIFGALQHFQSRNSVPEVQAYLSSQGDIEASRVDAGYTLLRAFIWAIPILGFIGTVLGISTAVSSLAESLEADGGTIVTAELDCGTSSDDLASQDGPAETTAGGQMIQAMGRVTQGLAIAFDTTFLALVMAIVLLFPTESLKKVEYGMLDRIDAFTNESLLRRMADDVADKALPPEVAKILEPAFRKHQQWLLDWQNKVATLGNAIGHDFETHVKQVQREIASLADGKASEAAALVDSCNAAVQGMSDAVSHLKSVSDDFRSSFEAASQLQQELSRNTTEMSQLADRLGAVQQAGPTSDAIEQLAAAARTLNDTATSVGTGTAQLAALIADGTQQLTGDGYTRKPSPLGSPVWTRVTDEKHIWNDDGQTTG